MKFQNCNFIVMDIKEFIQNFADQLDDTDVSVLTPETRFRELDEWSSLTALTVMAMCSDEYDVELTADEMRGANTIKDLYETVNSHL